MRMASPLIFALAASAVMSSSIEAKHVAPVTQPWTGKNSRCKLRTPHRHGRRTYSLVKTLDDDIALFRCKQTGQLVEMTYKVRK